MQEKISFKWATSYNRASGRVHFLSFLETITLMSSPIGQSDFKAVIDQNYNFVDKTLFIKDLLKIGLAFCGKTFVILRSLGTS